VRLCDQALRDGLASFRPAERTPDSRLLAAYARSLGSSFRGTVKQPHAPRTERPTMPIQSEEGRPGISLPVQTFRHEVAQGGFDTR
jgi:hypothetical protein